MGLLAIDGSRSRIEASAACGRGTWSPIESLRPSFVDVRSFPVRSCSSGPTTTAEFIPSGPATSTSSSVKSPADRSLRRTSAPGVRVRALPVGSPRSRRRTANVLCGAWSTKPSTARRFSSATRGPYVETVMCIRPWSRRTPTVASHAPTRSLAKTSICLPHTSAYSSTSSEIRDARYDRDFEHAERWGNNMTAVVKAPGFPASYEPVDWNPPGLPTDPDEIVARIADPARRGELYPLYHQLRRVAPIHRNRPEMFHGGWTFTRFAETDVIFKNPRVVNDPAVVDEAFTKGDGAFTEVMRNMMVWQEPEPHQRARNLVKSAFTPRAMARWRPIAERVANELCDRIAVDGHAELVEKFNYELPFNVIAHVLGIPEEDFPIIKALAWDFARLAERILPDDVIRRGDDATRALIAYFSDLVEDRKSKLGDDLLSSLILAEADGEQLTHTELIANAILLLQAGHET